MSEPTDELKSCPFCGAQLVPFKELGPGLWRGHTKGCFLHGATLHESSFAAWNQRTPAAPAVAPVPRGGIEPDWYTVSITQRRQIKKLRAALAEQHDWHMKRGVEVIEGVEIDMADAYDDSGMAERTRDILSEVPASSITGYEEFLARTPAAPVGDAERLDAAIHDTVAECVSVTATGDLEISYSLESRIRNLFAPLSRGWRDIDETGWLIEKRDANGTPIWLTLEPGTSEFWTTDSIKALRFCRREDADNYASLWGSEDETWYVTEHKWCSPPSQLRQET